MKRYRTIVADPPWPAPEWQRAGTGGRRRNPTELPYTTALSVDHVAAFRVDRWVADDCHLYLWVTPRLHRQGAGVQVAEAWGFDVVGEIIWAKPNYGLGHFPRPQHEPLLVCRRGTLPFRRNDVGSIQRWALVRAANNGGRIHSAKPDGALDLVEQASPGPYLELFARRARFGWDYAGDESLGTVEMSEAL